MLITFTLALFTAAALAYGVLAGTICNFATQLKFVFRYDDSLDIFASHAIGGVVGNVSSPQFRASISRSCADDALDRFALRFSHKRQLLDLMALPSFLEAGSTTTGDSSVSSSPTRLRV